MHVSSIRLQTDQNTLLFELLLIPCRISHLRVHLPVVPVRFSVCYLSSRPAASRSARGGLVSPFAKLPSLVASSLWILARCVGAIEASVAARRRPEPEKIKRERRESKQTIQSWDRFPSGCLSVVRRQFRGSFFGVVCFGWFISCWSDCAIQYHSKESHSSGSDTDAVSSISDVCYAVIEHHFKSRSGRIKECEFAVFLGTRVSCLSVSS